MDMGFGIVRPCPVCGKKFYVPELQEWVYKRSGIPLCSWTCLRKYDKGGFRARVYRPQAYWLRWYEMRKAGMSYKEIAEQEGVPISTISNACSRLAGYAREGRCELEAKGDE